ncbi:hypothetical protein NW757_001161 [Fusarium falciforme]|nr:hypothetical protein NW757_001161 [Fusarium falciforme]
MLLAAFDALNAPFSGSELLIRGYIMQRRDMRRDTKHGGFPGSLIVAGVKAGVSVRIVTISALAPFVLLWSSSTLPSGE